MNHYFPTISPRQVLASFKQASAKYSVDELYVNPKLGEKVLQKVLNLDATVEIQVCLQAYLDDSLRENLRVIQEVELKALNEKNDKLYHQKEELERGLEEFKEKPEALQEQKKQWERDIKDWQIEIPAMQEELTQIQPLAGKEAYDNRIQRLQEDIQKQTESLQEGLNKLTQIERELEQIPQLISAKERQITETENALSECYAKREPMEVFFRERIKLAEDFSKDEKEALKELFLLFWSEKEIEEARRKSRDSYNRKKELLPESLSPPTASTLACFNPSNLFVKDWRSRLTSLFNNPIPSEIRLLTNNHLTDTPSNIFPKDIATFFAIRSALSQNQELQTSDNFLFLPLSGGIVAQIGCRSASLNMPHEKYGLYRRQSFFSDDPEELVSHAFPSQELYYGYSSVYIRLAEGYYWWTSELIFDITLHPAAILFGMPQAATSLVGLASRKRDDDNDDIDY